MKYAIIDIGSNSMRLTLYEIGGDSFKILFKEKTMAGLAGYVEDGCLNGDGIKRAYTGLLEFKRTLELLDVNHVSVFATASLRNIRNTQETLNEICAATGYSIEVVTGEEEAVYGYIGAMRNLSMDQGVFVDIGGASTEIAVFSQGKLDSAASFRLGSLKLYRECVKNILPGKGSLKRIQKAIHDQLGEAQFPAHREGIQLACVGGTARAVLKIAKKMFGLSERENAVTAGQLEEICAVLSRGDKQAADLILKLVPERIHTIVPGISILRYIVEKFHASGIVVSSYGVREGYLCQKILKGEQMTTPLLKTGN